MTTFRRMTPRSLAGRMGWLCAAWVLAQTAVAVGQQAGKDPPKPPMFIGSGGCARCHTAPQPTDNTDFVLLNEFATWKGKDPHSRAFQSLRGERAQRMGQLLGYDVTTAHQCLSCHVISVPQDAPERLGRDFRFEDGVACEACHGPGERWLAPHFTLREWRELDPRTKEREYGMYNVRDPVRRAELCASCHVGSLGEGKVITHEMYAAGHPPLPSFEIETFSENLPRHWRYLPEKDKVREAMGFEPDLAYRSRCVLTSGVVVLREAARLLAETAAPEQGRVRWPELAHYDCFACHHELRRPSWRQVRGYGGGRAGYPTIKQWTTVLAGAAAESAGQPQPLERALKELRSALGAQPYGKREQVADKAREVAAACEGLLKTLGEQRLDRSQAKATLRRLSTDGAEGLADYDSARQILAAVRIIQSEVDPQPGKDSKVGLLLESLDRDLRLSLEPGRQTGEEPLTKMLRALEGYEPDRFRARFAELNTLLDAP